MRRIALVVGLLLLAACGGEAPGADRTTEPPTAATELTPTATPEPEASPTPAASPTPGSAPGGRQGVKPTPPPPTPTPDTRSPAARELARYVLTLDDLPEGWVEEPLDYAFAAGNIGVICDGETISSDTRYVARAGAQFTGGPIGPFLVDVRWQTATEDDARREMELTRRIYACSEWMYGAGDLAVRYALTPLALPQFGDESAAVQARLDLGGGNTLVMDSVYFRVGTMLANIVVMNVNTIDSGLTEHFARLAAEKGAPGSSTQALVGLPAGS